MGHFYRIFSLSFICFFILLAADSQTITNSYSFTWKYDTAYTMQNGYKNFSYTGSAQTFTATPGTYTIEVWGAQGGRGLDNSSNAGTESTYPAAKGGYSVGVLTLTHNATLYIYVGGQGTNGSGSGSLVSGGFNGGGNAPYTGHSGSGGASGGGGTDVRIVSGTWNNSAGLLSRIIVAGGGGGTGYPGDNNTPGHGGGTTGITGTASSSSSSSATGGTQSSGGTCSGSYGGADGNTGAFGYGGNGGTSGTSASGGGGGGGWYGGAGGKSGSANSCKNAGGGSGYVLTSSSYKPAGYTPTSDYYMTSANSIAGNTTMPAPGGGNETGHSGDGFAKITYNFKAVDHIDSSISHIYVTTTITDFVCKNGVYNKYGFTVNGSDLSSGVHTYTNHFSYGNTDSTVILNITIKPDVTAYEEIEAPYSYTWPANGETYTTSGIYNYTLVSQDGCDSSIILALTIYDPSGIDDKDARTTEFLITPNPSNDYIDITNDTHSDIEIQLYNSFGQKILSKKLTSKVTRIPLTNYPSGTYFISFSNNGKVIKTTKFIKSR